MMGKYLERCEPNCALTMTPQQKRKERARAAETVPGAAFTSSDADAYLGRFRVCSCFINVAYLLVTTPGARRVKAAEMKRLPN